MKKKRSFAPAPLLLSGVIILISMVTFVLSTASRPQPAGAAASLDQDNFVPILRNNPPPVPPTSLVLDLFADDFTSNTITDIAHAGDSRLFVVEREGIIRVVLSDGTVLPTPYLDITHLVNHNNWEEGLVGLVFHPDYAENGYFYVSFTGNFGENYTLHRYTVSADPNVADPDSGARLLFINKPDEVHHGGDLNFGPDGYLYVALGDGGPDPLPEGDPNAFPGDLYNNSQNLEVPLGSILRLDVDQSSGIQPDCGNGDYYTIPVDNPFVDGQGGNCDEIWVYGFRNPWRFSFDRQSGDMWIGDVGEWKREEIDLIPAGTPGGLNFGWHCREGTINYVNIWPEIEPDCQEGGYIDPTIEYGRTNGCSVTGGFVYRGQEFYNLRGHYLFADFCRGHIWRAVYGSQGWDKVLMLTAPHNVSTFGEDVNGELYIGTYISGKVYRVELP